MSNSCYAAQKFNHQPHEKHELFVRNSSFIRGVGVGRPLVCRGKFSFYYLCNLWTKFLIVLTLAAIAGVNREIPGEGNP
jgi:hypothetical protein